MEVQQFRHDLHNNPSVMFANCARKPTGLAHFYLLTVLIPIIIALAYSPLLATCNPSTYSINISFLFRSMSIYMCYVSTHIYTIPYLIMRYVRSIALLIILHLTCTYSLYTPLPCACTYTTRWKLRHIHAYPVTTMHSTNSLVMIIKKIYGNKRMFTLTRDYIAYTNPLTLISKLFQNIYQKMQRSKRFYFLFLSFFFQNHPT